MQPVNHVTQTKSKRRGLSQAHTGPVEALASISGDSPSSRVEKMVRDDAPSESHLEGGSVAL